MSLNGTENDAAIALALAEDDSQVWHQVSSNVDEVVKVKNVCDPPKSAPVCSQRKDLNDEKFSELELYAEIALILQIEEIVLAENRRKAATEKELNLEETRVEMTKQLKPTDKDDPLKRVIGIFGSIYSRYNDCQQKNQPLINQLRVVAVQILPLIKGLPKSPQKSKITSTAMAVGLVGNLINGKLNIDEIGQIVPSLMNLWKGSNNWFEFFEQIVYILVALAAPVAIGQTFLQPLLAKIPIA